jgi:hypothetical protein
MGECCVLFSAGKIINKGYTHQILIKTVHTKTTQFIKCTHHVVQGIACIMSMIIDKYSTLL